LLLFYCSYSVLVVLHRGASPQSGHYTTLELLPDSGWLEFDDTVVRRRQADYLTQLSSDVTPYVLLLKQLS
jgi:ubiquitin C-terminal hydrolase